MIPHIKTCSKPTIMDYVLKYHNVKIGPFSDHELKSAIQKYLRRNESSKGVFSLRLLLSVAQWMDKDPRRVKTILSNVINRMIVMMSEEISVCEPSICVMVETIYRQYLEDHDVRHILHLYLILLSCKKCRVLSDIRAVFLLPFFEDKDLGGIDIYNHNEIIKHLLPHLIIDDKRQISLKQWGDLLLQEKDTETIFYYLGFLLRPSHDRKSVITSIWKMLMDLSLPTDTKENIASLYFLYKKMTHREKTLYLYHAIMLAVLRPDPSPLKPIENKFELKFDKLSKQVMHFELDDYVLDMHTGNQKSTPYEFVMSGAWIAKEDHKYLNPKYRMIYIRKKQTSFHPQPCFYDLIVSPDPKSDTFDFQSLFNNFSMSSVPDVLNQYTVIPLSQDELAVILELPHGQKKCGQHKKVVYIADDYVYKGSYARKEKSFLNALFFQHALSQIEQESTILPIDILYDEVANSFFLRCKNIGTPVDPSDIEIVTTKIETNVKIIRRGSTLFRVSEIVDELDTLQKKKCLQHLYGRFLLNIGDSGLYNILLSKNNIIYGIDLEEQRNECKFTSVINLLAQRISKVNEGILSDALPWVDIIQQDVLETILKDQDWPKEYKDNILYRARFIECMLRHSQK